jgi:transcriptional regulator with XRE-family HTH domain
MARVEDSFRFPPELGLRLRSLRLHANLSLEEMVRRMGRSKGYISRISRLERGLLPYPSLALVADYLRVVRASFADILDILTTYTARPVPLEAAGRDRVREFTRQMPGDVARKLDAYDVKTSIDRRFSGKPPLEPDQRELRIRKQARHWLERGRLDRVINLEMGHLGPVPLPPIRKYAFDYGHKLWRILKQTRPKPGQLLNRRTRSRETRLAEAEQKAMEQNVIPPAGLQLVRQRAGELFADMESKNQLDYLPPLLEARRVEKPLSALFGRGTAAPAGPGRLRSPYGLTNPKLLGHVRCLVGTRMDEEGIKGDRRTAYFNWLPQLQMIAVATQPGSEERNQRTDALVERTTDPELSRRVAGWYYELFEHWRPRLFEDPPKPGSG